MTGQEPNCHTGDSLKDASRERKNFLLRFIRRMNPEQKEEKNSGEPKQLEQPKTSSPFAKPPTFQPAREEYQILYRGTIHRLIPDATQRAFELIGPVLKDPSNTISDPVVFYRGAPLRQNVIISSLSPLYVLEIRERDEEPPSKGSYFTSSAPPSSSSSSSSSFSRIPRQSSSTHTALLSSLSPSPAPQPAAPKEADAKKEAERTEKSDVVEMPPVDSEVEAAMKDPNAIRLFSDLISHFEKKPPNPLWTTPFRSTTEGLQFDHG